MLQPSCCSATDPGNRVPNQRRLILPGAIYSVQTPDSNAPTGSLPYRTPVDPNTANASHFAVPYRRPIRPDDEVIVFDSVAVQEGLGKLLIGGRGAIVDFR
jgi:hypothetical protein